MAVFIGIDPGLDGCVAIITPTSKQTLCMLHDTPTYTVTQGKKKKREYDLSAMKMLFKPFNHPFVCLEKQQAMKGQGVSSTFSTGFGFGLWKGLLAGMDIAFETVHPKTWQKEFFRCKAGESKKAAYKVANELYPLAQLLGPRGGFKDGRSDALLIATYAQRRALGMKTT